MASCDMCGREGSLFKTKIEGTEMDLCQGCSKFGEVIRKPGIRSKNIPSPKKTANAPTAPKRKEVIQMVVPDYAIKIKTARERLGLNQEEFSKKLNEKWSIMQKIESGQFKPSIGTARKLERVLRIRIVEEYNEGGEVPIGDEEKRATDGFTLGDFIKDKRKKKE